MSRLINFPRQRKFCSRFLLISLAMLLPLAVSTSQPHRFLISPIFQDNMVLQQRSVVSVWGKGTPQAKINLQASWGKKSTAVVGADSAWMLKLPTPKAGGPYELSLQHEDTAIVLKNVLIGEVWLCSGQSNMEMPLEGWPPNDTINNYVSEIATAQFPKIRLFNLQRSYALNPKDQCIGVWTECSPATVRQFSATAYFFGKKLHEILKVPIGLIESAWGGTPVEAWMSKQALSRFDEYSQTLKKLEMCRDSFAVQAAWLSAHPSIEVSKRTPEQKWLNLNFDDQSCSARDFADTSWDEMTLPTVWERTAVGNFDGTVWFRKRVEVPAAWIGKALTLRLGAIDDMDETYVNGEKVGGMMQEGAWNQERVYSVPATLVVDTVLQLAVRVIDYQGGGGIWGNGKLLGIAPDSSETGIDLSGMWKYLPVAEYQSGVFHVFGSQGNQFKNCPKLPFDFSAYAPTALFNGMINPLVPFALRGAIWYQGEANTDAPALYKRTFPAMIADWRSAFRQGDFPFYFTQLAPWAYGPRTESQYLRESQLQTLRVRNTGMAVTLDIGNPKNIHPANKQDVGKRLALWALGRTYGKKVTVSGPIFKSMKIAKGKAILSFNYADGGLTLRAINGEHPFLVAGTDSVFRKGQVRVDGMTLVVSHPEIRRPIAVRYAWSNEDEGTLFNKAGLPAPSFRTDSW